jgi:multidrug efflux pump subunit AcrA (membrane-fusion protein)
LYLIRRFIYIEKKIFPRENLRSQEEHKMPELTEQIPVSEAAPPKPAPGKNKRRKKGVLKLIVLLLVLAALATGGVFLYRFLAGSEEAQGEIFTQPAMIGSIQSKVSGSGTAMAKESAAITLTQGGIVQEVFVTAGDVVTAGQPLYSIYSLAAEEEVANAEKKVEARSKELSDLYENAANLTVRAPFAGKLQNVQSFEPDSTVGSGTTVATA